MKKLQFGRSSGSIFDNNIDRDVWLAKLRNIKKLDTARSHIYDREFIVYMKQNMIITYDTERDVSVCKRYTISDVIMNADNIIYSETPEVLDMSSFQKNFYMYKCIRSIFYFRYDVTVVFEQTEQSHEIWITYPDGYDIDSFKSDLALLISK